MDIMNQYRKRAIKFAEDWAEDFPDVSEHNIDTMVSIMCTRDMESYAGGDFAESIVRNDLYSAVIRADRANMKVLKLLALCNRNCFL